MRLAVAAMVALAAALAFAPTAAAQNEVRVDGSVTPIDPVEGDTVTVVANITNLQPVAQQNIVLSIQQGNTAVIQRSGINIPAHGSVNLTVTFVAKTPTVLDRDAGLTLQVQEVIGTPLGTQHFPTYHVRDAPIINTPFPIVPIAALAGIAVAGVAFMVMRQRKKEALARMAAEAAAKAEVERRVKAETARELAVTQKIHGKYPAEYFLRRRARLAVFVPSGMTSAGLSVLQLKKAEEKKIIYSCPRCGTHKETFDAPCPRCTVQDTVEALRVEVRKHKTGADFGDVSNLLQQAEFQLSYSSFGEAQVLVDQAKLAFNEILGGGERTLVKRLETISAGDHKPAILDLGLGTEHTLVDTAAEEQEHESREEYARDGAHCPTCGHAMYGALCAYCHFDDYAKLVEDAIAAAAKAGAETVEPRDLLERGRKTREEDNKSTGSRYLNRARYIAGKHLSDHLASKAEGMIDYARTLMIVGEEDGLTANLSQAEATLQEADAKKAAGDAAAAVELAERAENELHAALHELSKRVAIKRIDEGAKAVDDAREKGAIVALPDTKVKEARVAFDAGEFEKARDLAGEVGKLIQDATKGKSVCPKCGKPVQPTWPKCPFCTAPLR